jgi:GTP-binding protein era
MYKVGMVSITGRPNAGKSTLLNAIMKTHLAIVSDKVGTTRNNIIGIYNDDESQILFFDTPGLNKSFDRLGAKMNRNIREGIASSEVILFLVDIKKGFTDNDKKIVDTFKDLDKKVFLIINKIDGLSRDKILNKILEYQKYYDFDEIIPLSAQRGDNVDEVIKTIKKYLPEVEEKIYSEEEVTFNTLEFQVAELVREEILNLTYQEIPHEITCHTEEIEQTKNGYDIFVTVAVSRDNIKGIIIGQKGQMLKKIGTYARKKIEDLLGKKVYLELKVKTFKDWKNSDIKLKDLGF